MGGGETFRNRVPVRMISRADRRRQRRVLFLCTRIHTYIYIETLRCYKIRVFRLQKTVLPFAHAQFVNLKQNITYKRRVLE